MSVAAAMALALLGPGGGSWSCMAGERIEPGTWAVFQSRVLEDGGAELPSFHIRYIAAGEKVITQEMEWYYLPRWNPYLAAPDTIGFSVRNEKVDPKGTLKFSSGGQSWSLPQAPKFVHALGDFGGLWVELQGYSERHRFWNGAGWTVEALDRRRRPMGATVIRMPSPERVQEAYARLRVELATFEADPARHCQYYGRPEPDDAGMSIT